MTDYLEERNYKERLERDKRAREERRRAIMEPVKLAIDLLGENGQNMILGMAWQAMRAHRFFDEFVTVDEEKEQAISKGQIHMLEDLLGVERDRLSWTWYGKIGLGHGDTARMAIWDSEAQGTIWEDDTTVGTYKTLIDERTKEAKA